MIPKKVITSDGKDGGWLKGKRHSEGGIKAIVTDSGTPVELEGGEIIITRKASKEHCEELSRINQSGGGVAIPCDISDNKSTFRDGGKIPNVLLAPNGEPSKLTPKQYKLVRTPAFKKWFGDWENYPETASKVVDKNGEPLVVYHRSKKTFFVFDSKSS